LAGWELDIGLRRLASAGIALQGQPWEDHETGVAMALAGSPKAIQLEVVAPLGEDAPCLGALTRDGEGPYHCCWQVPNVKTMLESIRESAIEHTVVGSVENSALFPGNVTTFVFVEGLGLVELLEGTPVTNKLDATAHSMFRIRLESNDPQNAGRFLFMAGYALASSSVDDVQCAHWLAPDDSHVIDVIPVAGSLARIAWLACPDVDHLVSASGCEKSTSWWSRVRIDRQDV